MKGIFKIAIGLFVLIAVGSSIYYLFTMNSRGEQWEEKAHKRALERYAPSDLLLEDKFAQRLEPKGNGALVLTKQMLHYFEVTPTTSDVAIDRSTITEVKALDATRIQVTYGDKTATWWVEPNAETWRAAIAGK